MTTRRAKNTRRPPASPSQPFAWPTPPNTGPQTPNAQHLERRPFLGRASATVLYAWHTSLRAFKNRCAMYHAASRKVKRYPGSRPKKQNAALAQDSGIVLISNIQNFATCFTSSRKGGVDAEALLFGVPFTAATAKFADLPTLARMTFTLSRGPHSGLRRSATCFGRKYQLLNTKFEKGLSKTQNGLDQQHSLLRYSGTACGNVHA